MCQLLLHKITDIDKNEHLWAGINAISGAGVTDVRSNRHPACPPGDYREDPQGFRVC